MNKDDHYNTISLLEQNAKYLCTVKKAITDTIPIHFMYIPAEFTPEFTLEHVEFTPEHVC